MKELSNKQKLDILKIISMPEMTSEELDNCPVTQECRRRKHEISEWLIRDPEGLKAWGDAQAKKWGIETIDENHPFYQEVLEKRRKRLAAKAAKESITDAELFKKRPRI